ncbi:MAG TPA: serine/threonine protein kinase, partial [Pirellulales bacterium]|nr:serine/threonine protein kinase [Pirellulales bacterium]
AAVGDLKAQARIRVVPEFPWKFDFSDGEVPVTWVGARYRNIVREVDGNKAMVKVTTIPKGTRSQSWMGQPDHHDYTIQADIRGAQTNKKLPDMGLIAQRYTLDLMGASQQLQIRSWTPQLARFSKSIPFPWKPDTWYTLKFRAAAENGKAVLKGKIWKRGEAEPAGWTIEAVDEAPNLVGSPGLFGNANDAEITMDNILISSNTTK